MFAAWKTFGHHGVTTKVVMFGLGGPWLDMQPQIVEAAGAGAAPTPAWEAAPAMVSSAATAVATGPSRDRGVGVRG